MTYLTEEELVKLVKDAQDGNEDAYAELYSAYHDVMYKIALKNTMLSGKVNEQDAEDILQDAMLTSYKNIRSLLDPVKYPAWLSKIVVNKASDYMCSAAKKKNICFSTLANEDGEGKTLLYDPEDERITYRPDLKLEEETKQEILRDILDTLSDDQKIVTILYFYDGLSLKQIAKELEIEQSTVVGRLQTAKKNIKNRVVYLEKKQGIKLHSIAPLPFFLCCLGKASEETTGVTALTTVATSSVVKTGILSSVTASKVGVTIAIAATVGTAAIVVPKVLDTSMTVDVFENLTITYAGADGYGYITKIDYKESDGYKALENTDYTELLDSIVVTSNKTNNLSNGENITLTVTYDTKSAEEATVKFSETSKEYNVSGLKEYDTIDVWNSIEVVWEENVEQSDYVLKVNVKDNADVLKKVIFMPIYNEEDGSVKVTMDYTDVKDVEKYGFLPKDEKFSKTYKDMHKPAIEVQDEVEEQIQTESEQQETTTETTISRTKYDVTQTELEQYCGYTFGEHSGSEGRGPGFNWVDGVQVYNDYTVFAYGVFNGYDDLDSAVNAVESQEQANRTTYHRSYSGGQTWSIYIDDNGNLNQSSNGEFVAYIWANSYTTY